MRAATQELAHLLVQGRGFGHEVRFHHHIGHVEPVKRSGVAIGAADQLVHGAQEVFGMDHTDDVFRIVPKDRQAGVVGLQAFLHDVGRIGIRVDHLNPRTVQHDLFHRAFAQVERAQDAVAVLFFDDTLGMAQLQRPGDLFAHGKDVAVRVDLYPEKPQHTAHEIAYRRHHRREEQHHDADGPRDECCGPLGIGDGIGLGQNLREDEHQERHHQCRQRHAAFTEKPRKQRRCHGGGKDVDQVVAQKDRADQPFVILGDLKRSYRPA